jgi:hypothetical protein
MKRTLIAATLALLLWGMPALAGPPPVDSDGDGWNDIEDNCSDVPNPDQDDTDGDDCGNLCDADYDNTGLVGFIDFSAFSGAYGKTSDLAKDHTETVEGPVGFIDFSFFSGAYGGVPGPSGTTVGTTACP